jgi:hypothetical protein
LTLFLILSLSHSYAQINISKISAKDGDHYITTKIGYPIIGTYLFEEAEPIIQLNANGTGIFQHEDLVRRSIEWGIECSDAGGPLFKKGFDSATYTMWYKDVNGKDSNGDWNSVQFSMHFNSKKMFIMGNRCKKFVDTDTENKK